MNVSYYAVKMESLGEKETHLRCWRMYTHTSRAAQTTHPRIMVRLSRPRASFFLGRTFILLQDRRVSCRVWGKASGACRRARSRLHSLGCIWVSFETTLLLRVGAIGPAP